MTQRNTSHMLGATLIGGMVGAGLALLFAPRAGKETRDQISQNIDNLKQGAGDKLDRVKSRLHSKADQATELKDDLTEAAHQTGQKARSEIEELRNKSNRKSRRQSPVLSAWEEEV